MENIRNILSNPDHIPILALLVAVPFFFMVAVVQMWARDRGKYQDPLDKNKVLTYPYLVRIEFIISLLVVIILIVWSIMLNAPLEEEANPAVTPNPAKAPWYFVGLQEMLVYFDPWIAGVALPALIVVGLMSIPYLDYNRRGVGEYTFKERKWAVSIFTFGFLLWVLLIGVGTFCRGPGWLWYWPWEAWDTHRVVVEKNINLHEFFGLQDKTTISIFGGAVILAYYLGWLIISYVGLKIKKSQIFTHLGPLKFCFFIFLLASMFGLPIKMILKHLFSIKYICITPWFNI